MEGPPLVREVKLAVPIEAARIEEDGVEAVVGCLDHAGVAELQVSVQDRGPAVLHVLQGLERLGEELFAHHAELLRLVRESPQGLVEEGLEALLDEEAAPRRTEVVVRRLSPEECGHSEAVELVALWLMEVHLCHLLAEGLLHHGSRQRERIQIHVLGDEVAPSIRKITEPQRSGASHPTKPHCIQRCRFSFKHLFCREVSVDLHKEIRLLALKLESLVCCAREPDLTSLLKIS
mmetsp:Transcript_53046/g.108130  ORF Transcript_53046/g.108130 Transcript_53046/m.108130 type:complete len:234 (-) Transcript_53046:565-1266(-)